jgi:hypothetical protein
LAEVIEKGKLMSNRRVTERAAFHGDISNLKQGSSSLDKFVKNLKILIEEEKNDELAEQLESTEQSRETEFNAMLTQIKRVAAEVRDAKRFDVYKQLHVAASQGNLDSMGEQVINEEEEDQYEDEMGVQSDN